MCVGKRLSVFLVELPYPLNLIGLNQLWPFFAFTEKKSYRKSDQILTHLNELHTIEIIDHKKKSLAEINWKKRYCFF